MQDVILVVEVIANRLTVVVVVIITSVKPGGLEDHVGAILVYSTLLITNHH